MNGASISLFGLLDSSTSVRMNHREPTPSAFSGGGRRGQRCGQLFLEVTAEKLETSW